LAVNLWVLDRLPLATIIEMINESYYWKKELYDSYLIIYNFRYLKRKHPNSYVKVEKALMIGAYIIRKLNEASKIPPEFLNRKIALELFKSHNTIVDVMNSHHIDRHYDLKSILKEEKDWRFVINQLVHSFITINFYDEKDHFDGVLINSDKSKKKSLYYLRLELIFTIFLTVSEGDITKVHSCRDVIGKNKKNKPIYGEMKLKEAKYTYPDGFNINQIVSELLIGKVYKRIQ
jgi:hypothetical protein